MSVRKLTVSRRDRLRFEVENGVAQGSEPLPRRIVITYKDEAGQPQFWADLSNWNFSPGGFRRALTFSPPDARGPNSISKRTWQHRCYSHS